MKIICMNYGKLIILIIQPKILKVERQYAVKILNGTYECCHQLYVCGIFLFSTEKGFQRIISETLIFTVLINNNNYSMIVATLPEPTVLPPSRNLHLKFDGCSCVFLLILRHFY